MGDAELAALLGPGDTAAEREQLTAHLAALDPAKRDMLEYMAGVADELNAGRVPRGVLVNFGRRSRH